MPFLGDKMMSQTVHGASFETGRQVTIKYSQRNISGNCDNSLRKRFLVLWEILIRGFDLIWKVRGSKS